MTAPTDEPVDLTAAPPTRTTSQTAARRSTLGATNLLQLTRNFAPPIPSAGEQLHQMIRVVADRAGIPQRDKQKH